MSAPSETLGRYNRFAILLHWLTAVLILATISLGLYSSDNEGPLADQLTKMHKLLGIVILLLTIVRIGWRLTHRPPPLSATITFMLRCVARATHVAFYLMLLVLPLSGWWMTSAFPNRHAFGITGVFDVPFLPVEMSMASARAAHEVHQVSGWLMIVLIMLHVAAALKHHFYDRDDILTRMLGTK